MALFMEGSPCGWCGEPMHEKDHLIGFVFIGSSHPLVRRIDDGVLHRKCLSTWEHRDEVVRAWNREAKSAPWLLEITRNGEVRYLTLLGRILYACGLKHVPT